MSTCTKQIGMVVVGCPPAGTAPSFTLGWNVYIAAVPVEFQTDFLQPQFGICVFPGDAVWKCYKDNPYGDNGLDPLSDYVNAICPLNITGTAPITYSIVDGSLPSGLTIDPNTGYITGTSDDASEVGDVFTFKIRASNACGTLDSDEIVMYVGNTVYFGEWTPPEPGSFSANDIQVSMLDGTSFPAVTGPRYIPGNYTMFVGVDQLTAWGLQWFVAEAVAFPETFPGPNPHVDYVRVVAVPDGFFTGTNQNAADNPHYISAVSTINSVDNRFTYKETINLTTNGYTVPYRIFTSAATWESTSVNAYP